MGPINNDYTNASNYSSYIQSNQAQQIPSYEQGLRDLYTQITNDIKNVPTESLLQKLKIQTNLRQPQLDRALTVKLAIYRAIEQRSKSKASGRFKVTDKQLEKAKDIIYSEPNRLVVVQGFVDGTLQSVNRNSVSTKPVTTTRSTSNTESFTPEQKEEYTQNVANSYKSYIETFKSRPVDELMTVIEQAPTNERNIDTQNAAKLAAAKEIRRRFQQQDLNSIRVITESQNKKAFDILENNSDINSLRQVLNNPDKFNLQPRRPLPSNVSPVGTRPVPTNNTTSATATAKLSDEAFNSLKASLGNTTSPSDQTKALYDLAKLVRTPESMTISQEEQLGAAAYNMTNKDAVLKEFKGYNTGLDRMGEIINAEFSMRGFSAASAVTTSSVSSGASAASLISDLKNAATPDKQASALYQLASRARTPGGLSAQEKANFTSAAYNLSNRDAVLAKFKAYGTGLEAIGQITNEEIPMKGGVSATARPNSTASSSSVISSGRDVADLRQVLEGSTSPQDKATAYKELLQLAADGRIDRTMLDLMADKIRTNPAAKQALGGNAELLLKPMYLNNNLEDAIKALGIRPRSTNASTASNVSDSSSSSSVSTAPTPATIASGPDTPLSLDYQGYADVLEIKTGAKADIKTLLATIKDPNASTAKRLYSYLELVNQDTNGNTSSSLRPQIQTAANAIRGNEDIKKLFEARFPGADFNTLLNAGKDVPSAKIAGQLIKDLGIQSTDFAHTPGARRPVQADPQSTPRRNSNVASSSTAKAAKPAQQPITGAKVPAEKLLATFNKDIPAYYAAEADSDAEKTLMLKIANTWDNADKSKLGNIVDQYNAQTNKAEGRNLQFVVGDIKERIENEGITAPAPQSKSANTAAPSTNSAQTTTPKASSNLLQTFNNDIKAYYEATRNSQREKDAMLYLAEKWDQADQETRGKLIDAYESQVNKPANRPLNLIIGDIKERIVEQLVNTFNEDITAYENTEDPVEEKRLERKIVATWDSANKALLSEAIDKYNARYAGNDRLNLQAEVGYIREELAKDGITAPEPQSKPAAPVQTKAAASASPAVKITAEPLLKKFNEALTAYDKTEPNSAEEKRAMAGIVQLWDQFSTHNIDILSEAIDLYNAQPTEARPSEQSYSLQEVVGYFREELAKDRTQIIPAPQ